MRAWRSLIVPGLAAIVVCAILVGLGVWQLHRLAWKEGLIAEVSQRIDAPPVAAPGPVAWSGLDLAALEYQPVAVSGREPAADV